MRESPVRVKIGGRDIKTELLCCDKTQNEEPSTPGGGEDKLKKVKRNIHVSDISAMSDNPLHMKN